jgi:hypothetical protein
VSSTHRIKHDADDKGAAGARRNVLGVPELLARDLEAVAARAGVVEEIALGVVCQILQLDLVVDGLLRHRARS